MTAPPDALGPHWISAHACVVLHELRSPQGPLLGSEPLCIRDATPFRIMEFSAGRTAARRALDALGVTAHEVPQGNAGEPIWPAGICGSISHTDSFAVALVARTTAYDAVGVDIDDDRPIGDRAARDLTWARELRLMQSLGFSEDRGSAQNFVFSAKEAVFKCQYPLTGRRTLDFHQVRLVALAAGGLSTLSVSGWRVTAKVARVLGRITVVPMREHGQRVVCALCTPARLV